MPNEKKKRILVARYKKLVLPMLVVILLFLAVFLYSYKDCLNANIKLCLSSEKYASETTGLSFRYPNYFPLSKPEDNKELGYIMRDGLVERLEFAREFIPNAGGDRLGSITVETSGESSESYKKKLLTPQHLVSTRSENKIEIKPPEVRNVVIGNGIEALKITEKELNGNFDPSLSEYVVFNKGLKYTIRFDYDEYYHKLSKDKYLQGFELILSSLRIK